MYQSDIVIVGRGLTSSIAAAMLGRAGIATVLIDPRPVYPPELRCEKISGEQIGMLHKTGLADETLSATTVDGEVSEPASASSWQKNPATSPASCTTRWSTKSANKSPAACA